MTEMKSTETLCELLDERGVEYETKAFTSEGAPWSLDTKWRANGVLWCFTEFADGHTALSMLGNLHECTPEQAVAATLYSGEYESKMDALLSRLTNGKFSKSRTYDLDYMESCVNEEFEALYAKELADATLGSATLTAEQVREAIERNFGKVVVIDDGGEKVEWREGWVCNVGFNSQAIADELNALLGSGTCEIDYFDDGLDEALDGEIISYAPPTWYLTCGHTVQGMEAPSFCQECGKRVIEAVER